MKYIYFLFILINNDIRDMASISIPDLSFLNKNNYSSDIINRNYDTVSTLGMFTASVLVVLVFLLIGINNFFIFLGFFIILFIISIHNSIIHKKSIYPSIILLVIGLSIVFWQYHKQIIKKINKKENFYTLFQPYKPYRGTKPDTINTVSFSNTTTNLLQYRTNLLYFSYHLIDKQIVTFTSKLFLSKSKILQIQLIQKTLYEDILYDVYKNKTNIALLPSPIVQKGYYGKLEKYITQNMKNIQFIANIQKQFMFCISSVVTGVQNIYQIKNKKIGIPTLFKSIWSDIEKYIFPKNHINTFIYKNQYELVQDITNSKLDIIFYCGQYPNIFLNTIIESKISKSYQLLPIKLHNEKEFLHKNKYYRKYILSLDYDYMTSLYLPSSVNNIWKNNYNSDYETISFDMTLVCNNNLDDFTGYQIAKTITEGRNIITRNSTKNHLIYISDSFTKLDIVYPSLPNIPIQDGSKKFYVEKGLISYCNNPLCIFTIGYKKCDICNKIS